MRKFFVYTDGSCKGNPGGGGFAYTVYDEVGDVWYDGHGSHKDTTNNKMELYAVIRALTAIKTDHKICCVDVYSDSSYVVNCFKNGWIEKWEKNGWKTYNGKEVLNIEYWKHLKLLVDDMDVKFNKADRQDKKLKAVDQRAKSAAKKS